ncbi:MAG: hypothetical protein SPE82_05895 [Succinivibrio sp.]|nr:hypothetical protein [Succinatimonas sp.]MDY5064230.1 hypothetical protein [Succinivibrio sp.]PWM84510.1 MAG: hypothetical protein DBY31_00475 [Succinivibrio sp.]
MGKALVVMSQIVYTLKLLLDQGMERITNKVLSPKKTAHYVGHMSFTVTDHYKLLSIERMSVMN